MDVEAVADELYGLPVEEFTAARDGHAASARRDGDRELADAIKKLGRPTTAAWLANLLVRQRSQQIAELLELGAAMREAQAELAAEQMRALATQRRQIVSALGREAASLANDRGHRVSRAIREEMEGTLEAALADPGAAEALRSGQLTASLRYTGLGSVDISGAVAAPRRAGASTPKPPKAASRSTSGDGEADRKRRERIEAAEHKLEEARTEAADAQGARDAAERVVRDVQERVDGLRRQLDELEQQMQRLRGEEKFASKNLTEAERAKRTAADASRRAKEYVAKAEASLRSLTGRPEQ